ncbi:aminoglycoside phosphotransferase family protein [Hamadaea tsunoensis]|uniref:aminoglycoside phosphotransferase family protein n=1 Tax=Hamadaea tsunoensis TaxID=53368 RepID=UPI000425A4A9|nr:aminoglycoside phosphotransferase family protein [Hamadaea tsunoensis]
MTSPDVEITADLIAELLHDQHPDLAGLPLKFGAVGWDNQLWRLGDDLAVRLAWHTRDEEELLVKEYTLLPGMAPRLPLPIPVPQRLGRPSDRFPRPWIVTTWVAGEPADRAPVTRGAESADLLAAFLTALHQPAPDGAPVGRHRRGGPLAALDNGIADMIAATTERGLIADPQALREVWDDAVTAPAWNGPPVWLHGDLHPANVLTGDGNLCGVVDFGDLCAGNPAYDLAGAWLLLPDGAVDRFQRGYLPAADAATMRRARGCALMKALACLLIGDNGIHGRPGGKASWAPPAAAALQRLAATRNGPVTFSRRHSS